MDMITLAMSKAYTDKQRIAYEEEPIVFLPECTFDGTSHSTKIDANSFPVSPAVPAVVIYNSVKYRCDPLATSRNVIYGNASLLSSGNENTGEPFVVGVATNGTVTIKSSTGGTNTVSVESVPEVHVIDPKFIPAMDSLTLIGKDGLPYEVTVDESGVLTATAIG